MYYEPELRVTITADELQVSQMEAEMKAPAETDTELQLLCAASNLYKYEPSKEATGFNQLVCDYYYFCCYYESQQSGCYGNPRCRSYS